MALPDIIFSVLLLVVQTGWFVASLKWHRDVSAWRLERRLRRYGIDAKVAEELAGQYREMGNPLKYLRSRF